MKYHQFSCRFARIATLLATFAVASLVGCSDDDQRAGGCTVDTECKGERICSSEGRCVDPGGQTLIDAESQGDTGVTDAQSEDVRTQDAEPQDAEPQDAEPQDAEPQDAQDLDGSEPTDAGPGDATNDVTATDATDAATTDTSPGDASFDADTGDAGAPPKNCADYPNVAICIELRWDTPTDSDQTDTFGSDLDLHYLHPLGQWNSAPYDIYWQNLIADWNNDGSDTGDPELVVDDLDGAGPEVIVHDAPVDNTTYTVGVYYYADNTLGASQATVHVYINGQQRFVNSTAYQLDKDDFIEVVAISWPSEQISTIEQYSQGFP